MIDARRGALFVALSLALCPAVARAADLDLGHLLASRPLRWAVVVAVVAFVVWLAWALVTEPRARLFVARALLALGVTTTLTWAAVGWAALEAHTSGVVTSWRARMELEDQLRRVFRVDWHGDTFEVAPDLAAAASWISAEEHASVRASGFDVVGRAFGRRDGGAFVRLLRPERVLLSLASYPSDGSAPALVGRLAVEDGTRDGRLDERFLVATGDRLSALDASLEPIWSSELGTIPWPRGGDPVPVEERLVAAEGGVVFFLRAHGAARAVVRVEPDGRERSMPVPGWALALALAGIEDGPVVVSSFEVGHLPLDPETLVPPEASWETSWRRRFERWQSEQLRLAAIVAAVSLAIIALALSAARLLGGRRSPSTSSPIVRGEPTRAASARTPVERATLWLSVVSITLAAANLTALATLLHRTTSE